MTTSSQRGTQAGRLQDQMDGWDSSMVHGRRHRSRSTTASSCRQLAISPEPCIPTHTHAGFLAISCTTRCYGPRPSPCILPHALISHLVLGWPVAVGGECRPIGLLSGAVLLYAPTVKLPRRTAYLISAHASYAETRVI